jgi:hypothetical protein
VRVFHNNTNIQIDRFPDVSSKQLKFKLLNCSRGLNITELMVSISYMFC